MTDIQIIQNAEHFELRNRKPSPGKNDPDTQLGITSDIDRVSTTSNDAEPTLVGEPSLADFSTLIVTNTLSGDLKLSPSSSSSSSPSSSAQEPLFYISNGSFRPNTPSVAIHHSTKNGAILGTLKLGWGRDNTFGLGDPSKDSSITWENMRRTSDWTHATYEFSFGSGGDRRTYVWQRTKQRWFSDQPDMELREKLLGGGMGEVLAVYKGNQGMMLKSRGQFWVSRRGREGVDGGEGESGWKGANVGEWTGFQLIALLTGLGIIEASRRRARARRSNGGGS